VSASLGLEPVEIDLRRYIGKDSELRAVLSGFDLIYVRGGNTYILRRAFRQMRSPSVCEHAANDRW
jgi:dipeptidase E